MPVSIAELFVTVGADVTGALSGLQSVDRQTNATANAFRQAAPAAKVLTAAGAAAAYCLVKRWPTRGVVERSVPEDLPAWRRSTLRYPAETGAIMVACEALWMEVLPGRDRES